LVHGEIAVIAAWGAWSQMTLALRLPLSLLGSLLAGMVLLSAFGGWPGQRPVPLEQIVITLSTAMLHCILIQGMCLAARAFGIDWRSVETGESPVRRQAQFHLWELLALMAAVSLFLGAFRMLWPKDAVFDWQNITEDNLFLTSILLVGNLLLANTVITIYWHPRGRLTNLAITLALAATITVLEWLATQRLARPRSIMMFAWMNGLYMGWLLMSLGLVRLAGYRLERVRFPKWGRLRSEVSPL
ncbi:MAG: hypothetical protein K8R36_01575, partial [Planctomycetales bacterium]|nr:hypothetical protein [Planctomycetales bacterium]